MKNTTEEIKPIVIGSLSRLAKEKGLVDFLHALKILKDKNISFIAKIAGDGPELNNLLKLRSELKLEKEVEFLGWIEDLAKFYTSIDIFCLSSIKEGFGLVLLGAMNYNKPIVTTNCEGPLDILENNVDAIFCNKNNPESLAEALEKVITDTDLAVTLCKNAKIKFENTYSEKIVSKKINDFIENIYYDFYKKQSNSFKILNITYNSGNAGLENVFIDFENILNLNKKEVICFIPRKAKFKNKLEKNGNKPIESSFLRSRLFSPLLSVQLMILIKKYKPDIIILHNTRNIKIAKKLCKNKIALVCVNHGAKMEKSIIADYILSVNNSMIKEAENLGFDKNKIFKIDNMFNG